MPKEGTKAYAAFCSYRDLGPGRSVEKAADSVGKKQTGRPRGWHRWSSLFQWVKRAEAFDDYAEAERQRHFDERLKQLARDQADFAVDEFKRLVRRVQRADALLDKAEALPLTDVETIEEEGGKRKRKKFRGLDMARYAALMKEIRESARRAILGPREQEDGGGNPQGAPDFVVTGPDDDETA
jgi:hypothetical protein